MTIKYFSERFFTRADLVQEEMEDTTAKLEKVNFMISGSRSNTLLHALHYGIRAMGAMTLRIWELCLSFPTHPNISDGNFNLATHFFCMQIFQTDEKGVS